MIIDIQKEHIKNADELFDEGLKEFPKESDYVVLAINHFQSGNYAHISCPSGFSLSDLVITAANCSESISNNVNTHEERIFRRSGSKLIYRSATVV